MPPSKKKARKSIPKEPHEPLEYATYIREKSAKSFANAGRRKSVNYDIEHNIREIQALLKINGEIFGRCMNSVYHTRIDNSKSVFFTRHGYEFVSVYQNIHTDSTEFSTATRTTGKKFDMKPLCELPAGLADVFLVKYQAELYGAFIDYEKFFQSALMLHDEILEPFLAKLKSHIQSIHVCLGKIESWLLEPNSGIEFLEATFGKKLKIPTADDDEPTKYVLKSCKESGTFVKTFEVSNQSDQAKLKKFLEFIAS